MKSKNMTLMVIAIGCGLVAAFLTAKLSGGSTTDKVEVIVAKKDLPVGTILDNDKLEDLLGTLKFDAASLPPDVVKNAEELKGKRLSRTLKQGNYFSTTDVAADSGIKIPEGMFQYSIKTDSVKSVSGFVQAGDHVDVILTESQGNKAKSGMILRDMLILAVDTDSARRDGAKQAAVAQVGAVSMAVSSEQALTLSSAEKRGDVKLVLRNINDKDVKIVPPLEKIYPFDGDSLMQPSVGSALKTVSVVVARADVPVNTFVTKDNFNNFFALRELPEEGIPTKAVKDPATLWGKYVTNRLEAEMPLFTNWLSEEKVAGGRFDPVDLANLEMLPMPRTVEPEKPLYPKKFVQIINNREVYFMEIAPNEFRRVDANDEVKDLPPTKTPAPEDGNPAVFKNDRDGKKATSFAS